MWLRDILILSWHGFLKFFFPCALGRPSGWHFKTFFPRTGNSKFCCSKIRLIFRVGLFVHILPKEEMVDKQDFTWTNFIRKLYKLSRDKSTIKTKTFDKHKLQALFTTVHVHIYFSIWDAHWVKEENRTTSLFFEQPRNWFLNSSWQLVPFAQISIYPPQR